MLLLPRIKNGSYLSRRFRRIEVRTFATATISIILITALLPIVGPAASSDGGEGIMRAISVNPNRGDAGETIELEIFRENFEDGSRIRFTPSRAVIFIESVKFVNSTLLKATIQINGGAQALRYDLSVIHPNGYNSSTISDAFTVYEVRRNLPPSHRGAGDDVPQSASFPSGPSVLLSQQALIIMIGVIGIIVAVWWFRRHR